METELFGPVMTILFTKMQNGKTLELVDSTSEYALTGAVFSQDRYAIEVATVKLQNAAGNFYINDKPTGAVVGQQPFGGARAWNKRQSRFSIELIALGFSKNNQRNFCNQ
jgi:1-pyrroline-5-carboxylate dehydrogenase